jgi:hypothetical protein
MPIAILLLLIPGLVLGCDGEAIERDEAIVFYEGAYPIGQEIRDVADDWNIFLNAVEGGASDEDIIVMCNECQSRLEVLQDDLSLLYAPSPLRELKNNLTLCLTTGIEGFILEQQCILEGDIDYCIQGDEKLLELNSLLMVVADEWDDGIAHYEIEASEVLH